VSRSCSFGRRQRTEHSRLGGVFEKQREKRDVREVVFFLEAKRTWGRDRVLLGKAEEGVVPSSAHDF
jgi:hypothetical protein